MRINGCFWITGLALVVAAVAACLTRAASPAPTPIPVMYPVATGVQKFVVRNQAELEAAAKALAVLVITAWRAARYPENAPYILRNVPVSRAGLAALAGLDPARLAVAFLKPLEGQIR